MALAPVRDLAQELQQAREAEAREKPTAGPFTIRQTWLVKDGSTEAAVLELAQGEHAIRYCWECARRQCLHVLATRLNPPGELASPRRGKHE